MNSGEDWSRKWEMARSEAVPEKPRSPGSDLSLLLRDDLLWIEAFIPDRPRRYHTGTADIPDDVRGIQIVVRSDSTQECSV